MSNTQPLTVVNIGIDTHQELVVYMRKDCHICLAEGFNASSRLAISHGVNSIIATLNVTAGQTLNKGQIGLSKIALERLKVQAGDKVIINHAPVVHSLGAVRKKIFGKTLNDSEIRSIISDISAHRYSDIEISSFLSVCAGDRLNIDEIISLTKAMVECGHQLSWPNHKEIYDKHCIGGLPGNRTTPIVVSIACAAGLTIPKTSSRAITSPAGTADTMECLTQVNLELADIQQVVDNTGACLAWGGAVNLSPADDLLIRIEKALNLDGEGQLIASVLSKKIAAGSTHVLIDIPVGATAKVRTTSQAQHLVELFNEVAHACNITVTCVITDGSKPVGKGIGPVEEARDVLAVLNCQQDAPQDLRERSLFLAAQLINMAEKHSFEHAYKKATQLLNSGEANHKFTQILLHQGCFKKLTKAKFSHTELAHHNGTLTAIDNRKLARLTRLAGAPENPAAGLRLCANVGDLLTQQQPLFILYSESHGEQDYAMNYYANNQDIFIFEE
jgi:thymidine phosphorylase